MGFDRFGVSPALTVNGESSSRSKVGIFFTILVALAFIAFLIYESLDMIQKTNPDVVFSTLFNENPDEIELSPDYFNLAFSFKKPQSIERIESDGIYSIKAILEQYEEQEDEDGKTQLVREFQELEVKKCTIDDFGNGFSDKIPLQTLEDSWCFAPGQDIILEGTSTSSDYNQLVVLVSLCNQDNSEVPCQNEETIKETFDGAKFQVDYTGYAFDPDVYDEPVHTFRGVETAFGSPRLYKEISMKLSTVTIETDRGWILESIDDQTFPVLESFTSDANILGTPEGFLKFTIAMGGNEVSIQRTYKKVQDVLANTEGLINAVIVIFAFVIIPYAEKRFYEAVIKESYDVNLYKLPNKKVVYENIEDGANNQAQNQKSQEQMNQNLGNGAKSLQGNEYPRQDILDQNFQQQAQNDAAERKKQLSPKKFNPFSYVSKKELADDPGDVQLNMEEEKDSEKKGIDDQQEAYGKQRVDTENNMVKQIASKLGAGLSQESGDFKVQKENYFENRLTLGEYILGSYCCCMRSGRAQRKIKLINQGADVVNNTMDLKNMIRTVKDMEKLKALVLTYDQRVLFENLPKPVLEGETLKEIRQKMPLLFAELRGGFDGEQFRDESLVQKTLENYRRHPEEQSSLDKKLLKFYTDDRYLFK